MDTLVSLLVFFQALGASVGALLSIWSEFVYIRAMRDGRIDVAETAHMKIMADGLRFGMTIMLLASLGLVIVSYVLRDTLQPALSAGYWIFIMFALLIISISWALSRRRISFALGSATVLTAWWFLVYLTLGWLVPFSFGSAVMSFIVATAVIYAILHYARMLAVHTRHHDGASLAQK